MLKTREEKWRELMDLHENAERALRMVREAKEVVYDTETTGVDWRIHSPVGYVVGAPSRERGIYPEDVVYVPVRHGGGGNLPGAPAMTSPTEGFQLHPFEVELAKAFDERNQTVGLGRTVGHNMKFDAHMSANAGVMLGRRLACTQNMAAMVDEYAKKYRLEAVAEREGVTAKKGDEMYRHLADLFGGPAKPEAMANFWRTSGTDPVAYDYATGDGVTTLEVFWRLNDKLEEDGMQLVRDMENDLIWTVFRAERRGIKVDLDEVDNLRRATEDQIALLMEDLPIGFNSRSPVQMKQLMEEHGHTNWPHTEKGAPSFTQKWLKTHEIGRTIIAIRESSNLINSFINPLAERHVHKGRVHANLNQLKNDDKGTISGRFSCSDPNLQQVPKRNKALAKPFRKLFVTDGPEWMFWERDYSQCFVAGTKVSVPGGTKNIEDVKVGDLVYSYDDKLRLVLRPVTWSGRTGTRQVMRVHWATNGRTKGYVDCTPDHRFRKIDGSYVTAIDMYQSKWSNPKTKNPLHVRLLALRHEVKEERFGYKSIWLHPTGHKRTKEARLVYAEVYGEYPEHVHHVDGDSLNNDPKNLEGKTAEEHRGEHKPYGMDRMTPEQRKEASERATRGLLKSMGKNHFVTDVEWLDDVAVPVYDITVEDTHNFIANEVCVHNCEPRLFAHYAQDSNLLAGYNSTPFRDAHQVVADLLDVERDPTAKRMNMGIFTGMQPRTFADHMGWDLDRATKAWHAWFREFSAIQKFQNNAKERLKNRGYVFTLLGRRCRLEHPRFAYRGTSKIIQGSNADIIKYKMLEADIECERNNDIVQINMTVHDSFNGQYMDTPEGRKLFDEVVKNMEEVQVEPFNLSVPFVLEGTEGRNWSEATYGAD